MPKDMIQKILIDELLSSPAGGLLQKSMQTIENVQQQLYALATDEDSNKLKLLKIGTVFQIFLMDTLASGKHPKELGKEDWKSIVEKISQYAIFGTGQQYSEFIFTLYADYIDISAGVLKSEQSVSSIRELSAEIRSKTKAMQNGEIAETAYVEDCLWLSLEAMIKLLATFLSAKLIPIIGEDRAQLLQAVSNLAFEYGRYALYAKEQAILEEYIHNQYVLDEKLRAQYDAYLAEVQENAARFNHLIDVAFSGNLHDSLVHSAELARAAGVREKEILKSVEDIDAFFMD